MFSNCNSLQNITIPGRLLAGENVLRQCTGLKHFTIPEGTEVIGRGCFRNCTALESIDIPNTVTTIEGDAFHNCTSLRSVTIPNSVKTVGASFYGCSNLSDIKVPDHLYETSILVGLALPISLFRKAQRQSVASRIVPSLPASHSRKESRHFPIFRLQQPQSHRYPGRSVGHRSRIVRALY